MISLVAVLWAVFLTERFVRWQPGDWIFRRTPFGSTSGVERADVTFWNERLAFVWTSLWPGDLPFRFRGDCLDVAECRARVDEAHRHTRWLQRAAATLFFLLLVVFPGLVLTERLLPSLPYLAGSAVVAWGATVAIFFRSYRRVHDAGPPLEVWLTHALSPISLIGAPTAIALDASSSTHPVAAACVLCDDEEFVRIARLWHFDCPALRPEVERLAADRGLAARIAAPPREVESGLPQYCPRCHATFTAAAAHCADCPDVTLLRLETAGLPVESSTRNDDLSPSARQGGGHGGRDRHRRLPFDHPGARTARHARRPSRPKAS